MTKREAIAALRAKIAEITSDSRYKAKPAMAQINAPLALIQCEMRGNIHALTYALGILRQVKP